MTDRKKLKDRARDELFSHINRCGVLHAAEEDQQQWMNETMEYLSERYPDLSAADLDELATLGLRFCRPAIPHGRSGDSANDTESDEGAEDIREGEIEAVGAGAEDVNAA
jgi:hypothetical protein